MTFCLCMTPDYENAEVHYQQAMDEAFPALVDLREQGVIGAVGAGMNQWEMEWEFAKKIDVNCFLLAGRYTLLEQTSLDFLDWCTENDVSIFLGGVYNSGILGDWTNFRRHIRLHGRARGDSG